MHLAQRSYLLIMLAALLAVVGIWSSDRDLAHLWRIPAGLLLLGLAVEGAVIARLRPQARLMTAARAFLGRAQPATFQFTNRSARSLSLEYAPALPAGFESEAAVRRVRVPPRATIADPINILPVRLGPQRWPSVPARLLGPLALAWWNSALQLDNELTVAPEILRGWARVRGLGGGARTRRVAGAGQELHQLRVTREYSEDQHLDIFVAIDAGRLSRVRSGRLDRLGVYSNIAASFAEFVTHNDDRIGLVVYADRVLASCPPARGLAAVARLRHTLEHLSLRPAESDPTAAAVSIRRLLSQRALIVILTDLDDANVAEALARAVRLLAPPHLVLVAGVHSGEIDALARAEAQEWQDPWIALAASEHEQRAAAQRALLRRLGAPVVAASAERLQQALFERYEALRRERRV
jgi:uncharacterized protein (DUF58 family)